MGRNSLAIRLPAAVVKALNLKEGDEIEIHVADSRHLSNRVEPEVVDALKRSGRWKEGQ